MRRNIALVFRAVWLAITFICGIGVATDAYANPATEEFESILSPHFKTNEPGAAVIVVKDGTTLFRKAYGMADVEHHVHLEPEMRFRLASITKQFTAVAIMLLADEGELSVTDDIAKFLPDYPTHGKKITIENLLTHTSGIKNDTDMHGFAENMSADMSVQQVIDFFKNEPLDFDPGTRFSYSNSGYILLGAIIERISGQSYASFIAQRIFEPLGMTQTAYEGFERSGIQRVQGYSRNRKAFPISMTQPYAAGALVSTIDDLARWDATISSGQLLKPETWRKVFTPYTLTSGKATNYAYGWLIGELKGHQTVAHGGAISGFSSCVIRLPKEKIFVAVLTNNDRFDCLSWLAAKFTGNEPCTLAAKLAAIALEG